MLLIKQIISEYLVDCRQHVNSFIIQLYCIRILYTLPILFFEILCENYNLRYI